MRAQEPEGHPPFVEPGGRGAFEAADVVGPECEAGEPEA